MQALCERHAGSLQYFLPEYVLLVSYVQFEFAGHDVVSFPEQAILQLVEQAVYEVLPVGAVYDEGQEPDIPVSDVAPVYEIG